MRISDWSSDVCSSDLRVRAAAALHPALDAQRALEQAAVRVSIRNLRTFPCIPEREAEGRLTLRGAYFAISDGILHLLDTATDRFEPVPLNWTTGDDNGDAD